MNNDISEILRESAEIKEYLVMWRIEWIQSCAARMLLRKKRAISIEASGIHICVQIALRLREILSKSSDFGARVLNRRRQYREDEARNLKPGTKESFELTQHDTTETHSES
jgi:hypothetical protein